MADTSTPFYQKLSLNLLSIVLMGVILYLGQGILIPFFFSILLATLLLPVTRFLQRLKVPRVPSIILAIVFALILIAAIVYFLSNQVSVFLQDIETIQSRIDNLISQLQSWIDKTFNISKVKQNEYLKDTAEKVKDSGPGFVGKTVMTITESISYVVFLPVYTFLILYYKDLIKRFFIGVFKD
jgi:predicted PurR-regulated permease PerM